MLCITARRAIDVQKLLHFNKLGSIHDRWVVEPFRSLTGGMDNYLADPPVFIPPRSYLDLLDYGVGLYFMNFIHLDRLRLIDRRPLGGGSCFAVLNGFGASFMRYVDSILTIIARRQQQQQ